MLEDVRCTHICCSLHTYACSKVGSHFFGCQYFIVYHSVSWIHKPTSLEALWITASATSAAGELLVGLLNNCRSRGGGLQRLRKSKLPMTLPSLLVKPLMGVLPLLVLHLHLVHHGDGLSNSIFLAILFFLLAVHGREAGSTPTPTGSAEIGPATPTRKVTTASTVTAKATTTSIFTAASAAVEATPMASTPFVSWRGGWRASEEVGGLASYVWRGLLPVTDFGWGLTPTVWVTGRGSTPAWNINKLYTLFRKLLFYNRIL